MTRQHGKLGVCRADFLEDTEGGRSVPLRESRIR